jgi:hypothetical protein
LTEAVFTSDLNPLVVVHGMNKTRSLRYAATLSELLFGMAALLAGFVFARMGGERLGWWGYPLGFVGGIALAMVLALIYAAAVDLLWSGIPPHPPTCRSGKCRWEDFELRRVGDNGAGWFCRCGDQYRKRDRRWVQILPDNSERRFVIWRPIGGWVNDKDAT